VSWQSRQAPAVPPPTGVQETVLAVAATSGKAAGVSPPPLLELTDTVARPLFTISRRPEEEPAETAPEAKVETVVTPTAPPALRLSAVIIEPDRRQALLIPKDGGAPMRVLQGAEVQGWTLSEVRDDAVVLSRGSARHELTLRTFEPPPQPVRRAPAARAGQASEDRAEAPRAALPEGTRTIPRRR
jgi:hypothetical protein